MNPLLSLASQPVVERLGWVLIHFIWQGMAVGLLLVVLLRLLPRASAHLRYLVLCGALLACGLAPIITWLILANETDTVQFVQETDGVASPHALYSPQAATKHLPLVVISETGSQSIAAWSLYYLRLLDRQLSHAVALWFAGVWVLTTRLTFGWTGVRRLRRSGTE